jgi:hypothetical protein
MPFEHPAEISLRMPFLPSLFSAEDGRPAHRPYTESIDFTYTSGPFGLELAEEAVTSST